MPKVNWNTIILTVGFSILGFTGKELYTEVRLTHDAVLLMKSQMVSHSEYDVQISDVRARITAVEVEIQKMKDRRAPPLGP